MSNNSGVPIYKEEGNKFIRLRVDDQVMKRLNAYSNTNRVSVTFYINVFSYVSVILLR